MYRKCSGWGHAFHLQLYVQVPFEQRDKRRNYENIWEKHVMGREESKHKDQKAGAWPGTGNGGRSVEQRGKE